MIEKKDPRPEVARFDPSEDDLIIELTDPVIPPPEDNDDIIELENEIAAAGDPADFNASISEDDQETATLDETHDAALKFEGTLEEPADRFGDPEDELIASAINKSLESEEAADGTIASGAQTGLEFEDSDASIALGGEDDETDVDIRDSAGLEDDADGSDLEEEIALDYESDEDDLDLATLEVPALDEELIEDQHEPEALTVDAPPGAEIEKDWTTLAHHYEPEAKADAEPIGIDEDLVEDDTLAAMTDDDSLELESGEDLPGSDVSAAIESLEDFEIPALDSEPGDEDIIDLADDETLEFEHEEDLLEFEDNVDLEAADDLKVPVPGEAAQEGEDIVALADDDTLEFEHEENLFDFEDTVDLEAEDDDEIIPIEISPEIEASTTDEVIEITEFDHHYAETVEPIGTAGDLDRPDSVEEEFLELIEVEEDRPAEDEEILDFGGIEDETTTDEINRFFSDALEEDEGFENGLADQDASTLAPVSGAPEDAAAAPSDSEEDKFDFDSKEISRQIDRLDAFWYDDSKPEPAAVDSLADEPPAEDALADLAIPEPAMKAESPALTPEQVDKAIERLINEKFSGKIETIIYNVIEKTVSKEIDRLKGILLEDDSLGDNQ